MEDNPPVASPAGGSTDVFISYSRSDQEFVRALVAALAGQEKKAWVDWEAIPPTAEWLAEIHAAIETSDAFLFVISPDSSSSAMCREELAHAEKLGKRIVPVNIRLVDPADLPPTLAELQWIAFGDGRSFDRSVEELVEALDTDLEWVREHTHWLAKAREWERRGRDRSFLLRGSELRAAESWLTTSGGAAKEPAATPLQIEFVFAGRQAAIRRQRMFVASVAIALLVTLVLAVVAYLQRNQAISERKTAVSELLASASRERLDTSLDTALLLAAAAYDARKTLAARDALLAGVRRTESIARLFRVLPPASPRTAAVGRDGRMLASGTADELALFDVRRGERVATVEVDSLTALALAADSSLLATVEDGRVGLRSISRAGDVGVSRPVAPIRNAVSVAFAPDRPLLAVGRADGRIWLRNLATGAAPATLRVERPLGPTGPAAPLHVLAFDARGRKLAAGSPFGTYVIDVSGKPRYEGLRKSGYVDALAFVDSETLVVVTVDGAVAVIDARSADSRCTPGLRGVSAMHVASGGSLIAAGKDGGIRVTRGPCLKTKRVVRGRGSPIAAIGALSGTSRLVSVDSSGLAIVWDALGFDLARSSSSGVDVASDIAHGWAEDEMVVSGLSGVFLVGPGQTRARLEGAPEEATALASSPSAVALAAAGATTSLWTGRGYAAAPPPGAKPGVSVALSSDGRILAVGRARGVVDLWDVAASTRLARLQTGAKQSSVTALAFSADGRLAAGDSGGRLVTWDDDRERTVVASSRAKVEALAFAPGDDLLAVASGSELTGPEIVLWDLSDNSRRVISTADAVGDLGFTPDGKQLVSGDVEGRLIVWDTETGRVLGGAYDLGDELIRGVDVDLAHRSVAVVGGGGTVHRLDASLWDVEAARTRICMIAGRTLSPDEWEETAPGLRQPGTC
jgi:WD40 repeat protein